MMPTDPARKAIFSKTPQQIIDEFKPFFPHAINLDKIATDEAIVDIQYVALTRVIGTLSLLAMQTMAQLALSAGLDNDQIDKDDEEDYGSDTQATVAKLQSMGAYIALPADPRQHERTQQQFLQTLKPYIDFFITAQHVRDLFNHEVPSQSTKQFILKLSPLHQVLRGLPQVLCGSWAHYENIAEIRLGTRLAILDILLDPANAKAQADPLHFYRQVYPLLSPKEIDVAYQEPTVRGIPIEEGGIPIYKDALAWAAFENEAKFTLQQQAELRRIISEDKNTINAFTFRHFQMYQKLDSHQQAIYAKPIHFSKYMPWINFLSECQRGLRKLDSKQLKRLDGIMILANSDVGNPEFIRRINNGCAEAAQPLLNIHQKRIFDKYFKKQSPVFSSTGRIHLKFCKTSSGAVVNSPAKERNTVESASPKDEFNLDQRHAKGSNRLFASKLAVPMDAKETLSPLAFSPTTPELSSMQELSPVKAMDTDEDSTPVAVSMITVSPPQALC
jgi:hypothetical protein